MVAGGSMACTKSKQDVGADRSSAAPDSDLAPTDAASRPADQWRRVVDPDALSEAARKRFVEAQAAKKALGQALMGRLTAAVGQGDFAAGVAACKEAAPLAQRAVSADHEVAIGRTSHRVRNPKNAPVGWQKRFVDDRTTEEVVLQSSAGALRYMSPIMTAEICLNCHGSPEQVSPAVTEMLGEKYPRDQATGFKVGELRGWFWVEVAAR